MVGFVRRLQYLFSRLRPVPHLHTILSSAAICILSSAAICQYLSTSPYSFFFCKPNKFLFGKLYASGVMLWRRSCILLCPCETIVLLNIPADIISASV